MPRRSFYDLNFRVDPGGARKDAHYIRGGLDEVRADLAAELAEGFNLYLLCWYGAELSLRVYQRGELAHVIDLHPFITISISGYPNITFTGPGEPLGWDFKSGDEESVADGSLADRLFAGEFDDTVNVTVDWARLDVPPLAGDVAVVGDLVNIDGGWLDEVKEAEADESALLYEGYIPYGFTDLEE